MIHFPSALNTSGNVVAGSGRLLLGEWDGVHRMFVRHRFSLFFKVLLFSLAHPELLLVVNHFSKYFQSALNTSGNVKPGSARLLLGEWDGVRRMFVRHRFFDFFFSSQGTLVFTRPP